jgi:FolB domain-containing protein
VGASIMPPPGQRCIVVDDLRLAVFIGVHEHEKQARQEVSITIHMFVPDDAAASRSDDLADHVSYSDVVAKLKERAKAVRHTNLVETLAEEAANFALADARVEAKGVGVIIRRQRGTG